MSSLSPFAHRLNISAGQFYHVDFDFCLVSHRKINFEDLSVKICPSHILTLSCVGARKKIRFRHSSRNKHKNAVPRKIDFSQISATRKKVTWLNSLIKECITSCRSGQSSAKASGSVVVLLSLIFYSSAHFLLEIINWDIETNNNMLSRIGFESQCDMSFWFDIMWNISLQPKVWTVYIYICIEVLIPVGFFNYHVLVNEIFKSKV